MIEMMTAYTTEVDEVEDGINEILRTIDLGKLKKNSIGLITCHYDFTETGFITELQKKLPFDVIGMTTMASANNIGFSMYALSLTVLTSDDVVFETAITGPLSPQDYKEKITASYKESKNKLSGDPSLIIAFFPFLKNLSGAVMVNILDQACGSIPIWGSLATNIDVSYEKCHAFRNKEAGEDALVILLMRGAVDPEFIVVSIPESNINSNRGMITDSDGCVLKKINDMPALAYLESIGVTIIENAPTVTPLMVYYEGSSEPVALGIYSVLEDGGLLCGGEMTRGATVAVGAINNTGILSSAAEGTEKLLKSGKKNGALMLPCVTRYVMLSPDQDREIKQITDVMRNQMPYMMGYSGGEVCPIKDRYGKLQNRFHNYTYSACVF